MSRMWRWLALPVSVVLVATVLVAMPRITGDGEADAANAADFNPGYIISDANFYNGSAMTAGQVSTWLHGVNSGCAAGKKCILNYTENTPTMAADAYCSRVEGKRGESAASVIAKVGKACNISQKALLVLLEKEQSLISLKDVPNWKWESATGYGCPDTAPCDAGFGGFFTQVYFGARAYQYYKAHPTQYRHQPMATNSVLYNPNGACGSSSVYIQNYATAGLYNYTPYQPNRAAMSNLYGVGDACSAYGNRNFWRMYSDWFGSPTADTRTFHAQLVTTGGSGKTWLVDGSSRHAIQPDAVANYRAAMGAPKTVTSAQLNGLKDGGSLGYGIKSGHRIWHVDKDKRVEFMSCDAARAFGYDCASMPDLSMDIILKFKGAGSMKNLVGWSGGGWWYIKNGVRQQVPDFSSLKQLGISESRTWLTGNRLTQIPVAGPLMPNGAVAHDLYTGQKFMATKGGYLKLSTRQGAQAQYSNSSWIWPGSIAGMQNRTHISDRVQYPGKRYILSEKGLVVLGGNYYGSSTHFQTVQVPMLWGVPIDGPRNKGGILVQQTGKSEVWLVTGGKKQLVSKSQLQSMVNKYGSVVKTASDTTIGVPLAAKNNMLSLQSQAAPVTDLASGDLVESASSGEQFIYSAAEGLVKVQDPAFAAALGIDDEATVLDDDVFASLEASDIELNTWGITCAGESYFAADGVLTPFAQNALQHYPLGFVELPADICEQLQIAEIEVSQTVEDSEGQVWLIEDGRKHLASEEWLAENPQPGTLFVVPDAYLSQVTTGKALT